MNMYCKFAVACFVISLLFHCQQTQDDTPAKTARKADLKESPKEATSNEHGEKSNPHWDYKGKDDPDHWGELSKKFSLCKTGHEQSPINIEKIVHKTSSHPLEISYQESPVHLLNNGHTVQANYDPGSHLIFSEKKYKLLQFHFHTPSEHHLKGKEFPMEMHLVHQNENGELAVVGIFIEEGQENPVFAKFWDQLPEKNKEVPTEIIVGLESFFAEEIHYEAYNGSLTTPPCTEHVQWLILRDHSHASKEQLEKISALLDHNNRPIQDLNNRIVEDF